MPDKRSHNKKSVKEVEPEKPEEEEGQSWFCCICGGFVWMIYGPLYNLMYYSFYGAWVFLSFLFGGCFRCLNFVRIRFAEWALGWGFLVAAFCFFIFIWPFLVIYEYNYVPVSWACPEHYYWVWAHCVLNATESFNSTK